MLTTILALATLTLAILLAYQTVILRDMERRLDSLCAHLIEVNHNTDETHALLCQLATADLDVSWGDTDGAYTFEAHERNGVGHD